MNGPILKGKKVILQPARASEAKNYVKWLSDPEITKFISNVMVGLTVEKEKELLKKKKTEPGYFWSVYTKAGKHIGSTGFHGFSPAHKRVTWGVMIGDKTEWNKGYGTDILNTLMAYVFNKLKFQRFELEVFSKNKAGIRCYTKCGFKREGLKRKHFLKNGKTYDSIVMAVTDDDYRKIHDSI